MLPNLLICLHDDVGISAIFRINIYIFLFGALLIIYKYISMISRLYLIIYIYLDLHLDLNKVLNTFHNDSHCKLYYSPLLVLGYMNISKKKTKFLS